MRTSLARRASSRLSSAGVPRTTASSPRPGHTRGGDGGLFAGILARYLAEAAASFSGGPADDEQREVAESARRLVRVNAEALWEGRRGDLFPADPRRAARADGDDLDLSVQLGAWITLEAGVAASLTS